MDFAVNEIGLSEVVQGDGGNLSLENWITH